MDYQFEEDDLEYYEIIEEEFPDEYLGMEYDYPSTSPDPILIAGVTLLVGILLFGFLTQLTKYVFGDNLSIASNQQSNQNPQGVPTNQIAENNLKYPSESGWNGECAVSQQFPAKVTRWCELITQYSAKHNIDPDLIAAVVWLESGGNELAYSRSGAVGLMQVMPNDGLAAAFMCVNGPCFKDRPSSNELRDPEFNIAFGTRFLASLVRRYGNIRDALKSYGPMDAGYTYSDKVINIFNRYKSD